MWSKEALSNICKEPSNDKSQRVFLQVSTDGGKYMGCVLRESSSI